MISPILPAHERDSKCAVILHALIQVPNLLNASYLASVIACRQIGMNSNNTSPAAGLYLLSSKLGKKPVKWRIVYHQTYTV